MTANELKDAFLDPSCDVLSMSMLSRGLNAGNASIPTRFDLIEMDSMQAMHHGNYALFYDENNSLLDPLSLFLYPQMRLISSVIIESEYNDVTLMGILGGGWYSVWLAALMPEIQTTMSYAGRVKSKICCKFSLVRLAT